MLKHLLLIVFISVLATTNSKAQWSACGSGFDSQPYDMVVYNNELYVSNVDSAGGIPITCLAKWNETNWSAFGGSGPDVSGIAEMIVYNGNLVVSGGFTAIDGFPATRIAMWNGSSWDSLSSGLDGGIYSMTIFNGDLIVGGNFSNAGGVSAKKIAKWDGTTWSNMHDGFDGPVEAFAVYNNELYAGGNFIRSGQDTMYYIAKWNGADWDSLGNDELNGEVSTLEVYNGSLYAGGDFDFDSVNYVGYWDGVVWNGCNNGVNDWVYDLEVYNGELYVGGFFDEAYDGTDINFVGRWNGNSWAVCGSGMDEEVDDFCVFNGKIYASGYFEHADGILTNYIAGWSVPSAIDEINNDDPVSVLPNPTAGKFTFDFADVQTVPMKIFNALGETVFADNRFKRNSEIDLNELAPGIYFALINFKDKQVRKKIVLQ